jgi:DNA-binding GntR family transcriptional regulator
MGGVTPSANEGTGMERFEMKPRSTTVENAYEALQHAILSGQLAQGVQLREAGLASMLGISRPPLREALRQLEEQGLVQRIPYRGAFVAEVTKETIDEIASVRRLVEPYAVELGLPHLRGEGRPEIEATLAELDRAAQTDDLASCLEAHLILHRQCYQASGHSLLLSLWNGWENKLRLFLASELQGPETPVTTAESHRQLWNTILDGDPDKISETIKVHVHGSTPDVPDGDERHQSNNRAERPLEYL